MPDQRLVRKGRAEPLAALLQQARVSYEVATNAKHVPNLEANGWSPDDTTLMASAIAELGTEAAATADAYGTALFLTASQERAIDEVKKFIRKLRNALPRALRTAPEGVTAESFHAGGELRRSVPKLSAYLAKIRPSVVLMDANLKSFFGGSDASSLLDEVKNRLDNADAIQEATLEQLPAETQMVYERKGRLLEMIEDLNRSGKSAYDGSATEMAVFNKDVLLRARSKRKK